MERVFPSSLRQALPMSVGLSFPEVPTGTPNAFTIPSKIVYLTLGRVPLKNKNKQTKDPVALAKQKAGSSDVTADGSCRSFVCAWDSLARCLLN